MTDELAAKIVAAASADKAKRAAHKAVAVARNDSIKAAGELWAAVATEIKTLPKEWFIHRSSGSRHWEVFLHADMSPNGARPNAHLTVMVVCPNGVPKWQVRRHGAPFGLSTGTDLLPLIQKNYNMMVVTRVVEG